MGATALLMGLVGGPHCVAMCGAACAGLGQAAGSRKNTAIFSFQLGRVVGYAALGALAAASMQGLGWLTIQSTALRPLWSMLHVAAILLGMVLLVRARQPVWLEMAGKRLWTKARAFGISHGSAPLVLGTLWALLPCGLLYSAVAVAALAGGPLDGAAVMALFAVGTSFTMTAAPWLWLKLRGGVQGDGAWGVRLAGLALAASSSWGLWMGLMHNTAPWCVNP
jgi:sulfite exporter TauE/SafE